MERSSELKNINTKRRQIKKISIADQVYHALEEDIQNGVWGKGEKLPSEGDIAASLNVNRLTVRLALQKLNTLGYIETRVGEGSFVIGTSFEENISEFAKYYMDDDIIDDVEEFRELIEFRCVTLAVQNAADEEFDELERCCAEFERCSREFSEIDDEAHYKALLEADFNFHSTICALSHNRLYSYAYNMAKEPICRFLGLIISERDEKLKNVKVVDPETRTDSHRRLLNAMRSRDLVKCKAIFEEIVEYDHPQQAGETGSYYQKASNQD